MTWFMRMNFRRSGAQLVQTRVGDWLFHPTDASVDVAVLPFQETAGMDFKLFPFEALVSDEVIRREGIGIGDEVFITGLFKNYFGEHRNIPILRVGNIACMPEEPILTSMYGTMAAYLIEAKSIGGLSGSPVFVNLGRHTSDRLLFTTTRIGVFYLLGLIHGHWYLPPDPNFDDAVTEDVSVSDRRNTGIAIVTPASKILEVINQETLVEAREKFYSEESTRKALLTEASFSFHAGLLSPPPGSSAGPIEASLPLSREDAEVGPASSDEVEEKGESDAATPR